MNVPLPVENTKALLQNLLDELQHIKGEADRINVEGYNAYYKLQVTNHIRRVEFNIKEALDYLEFLDGTKVVQGVNT